MKKVAITGSINVGKSTATHMLRSMGFPTQSSDEVVHALLENNSDVFESIKKIVPQACSGRKVHRSVLAKEVEGNPSLLTTLEKILHPYVFKAHESFFAECQAKGAALGVVDVPLLFEAGREKEFDIIIAIKAWGPVRLARLVTRPRLTLKKFLFMNKRQLPSKEKERRAHYVVSSTFGRRCMKRQLEKIVRKIL